MGDVAWLLDFLPLQGQLSSEGPLVAGNERSLVEVPANGCFFSVGHLVGNEMSLSRTTPGQGESWIDVACRESAQACGLVDAKCDGQPHDDKKAKAIAGSPAAGGSRWEEAITLGRSPRAGRDHRPSDGGEDSEQGRADQPRGIREQGPREHLIGGAHRSGQRRRGSGDAERIEQGRSTERSAGEPERRSEKRESDGPPPTDSDPVARMRERKRRSCRRAGEQRDRDRCPHGVPLA